MIELTGRLICRTAAEADRLRAHLPEHVRRTRNEPGCLLFEVAETEDPLVWSVHERFRSRDDFDAHQVRAGASDWAQATQGVLRDYAIRDIPG